MQRVFGNLPPYLREKKVLGYRVLIHLRHVADFSSRSPSPPPGPSPPSDDGDSGQDDDPNREYAESQGFKPRLYGFPMAMGVEDGCSPPHDELAAGPSRRNATRSPPLRHATPRAIAATHPAARSANPPQDPTHGGFNGRRQNATAATSTASKTVRLTRSMHLGAEKGVPPCDPGNITQRWDGGVRATPEHCLCRAAQHCSASNPAGGVTGTPHLGT